MRKQCKKKLLNGNYAWRRICWRHAFWNVRRSWLAPTGTSVTTKNVSALRWRLRRLRPGNGIWQRAKCDGPQIRRWYSGFRLGPLVRIGEFRTPSIRMMPVRWKRHFNAQWRLVTLRPITVSFARTAALYG